jgi:hypothetical protein
MLLANQTMVDAGRSLSGPLLFACPLPCGSSWPAVGSSCPASSRPQDVPHR